VSWVGTGDVDAVKGALEVDASDLANFVFSGAVVVVVAAYP
jgi:hypothetical protein